MDLRARFYVEAAMALVFASLCLLTIISPQWIEAVFGVDPDLGLGGAEWAAVVCTGAAAAAFSGLARAEWRQTMFRNAER